MQMESVKLQNPFRLSNSMDFSAVEDEFRIRGRVLLLVMLELGHVRAIIIGRALDTADGITRGHVGRDVSLAAQGDQIFKHGAQLKGQG